MLALQCYCGAVRLEVDPNAAPAMSPVMCHCQSCRRACGGLFQYAVYLPRSSVQVVLGSPVAPTRHPNVTRAFCGDCGGRVMNTHKHMVGVFPACLVDCPLPEAWKPRAHIFYAERLLDAPPDGLPRYNGDALRDPATLELLPVPN